MFDSCRLCTSRVESVANQKQADHVGCHQEVGSGDIHVQQRLQYRERMRRRGRGGERVREREGTHFDINVYFH